MSYSAKSTATRTSELTRAFDCLENCADPDVKIGALLSACELALEHVQELEDAWTRGAIHDIDEQGGTRSNRNKSVEVMLRKIIAVTKGEPYP